MKRKVHKKKKPRRKLGPWLANIGTFLLGVASICEIVFKIVAYLSE